MKTFVEIKIRGYHIDQFNHVNNARYLEFLEEGRWGYLEQNNLIKEFHVKGIGHAVVNININYRKSAFLGQILRIETDLLRKGRASITIQQKLFLGHTDTLIADAEVSNVFLNPETGKAIPVDIEFIKLWPELGDLP